MQGGTVVFCVDIVVVLDTFGKLVADVASGPVYEGRVEVDVLVEETVVV